jgi:hypothetical protein
MPTGGFDCHFERREKSFPAINSGGSPSGRWLSLFLQLVQLLLHLLLLAIDVGFLAIELSLLPRQCLLIFGFTFHPNNRNGYAAANSQR